MSESGTLDTPSQTTSTARRAATPSAIASSLRVVPEAAVADAADERGRELAPVVPLARRPASPQLLAVPVVGDRARRRRGTTAARGAAPGAAARPPAAATGGAPAARRTARRTSSRPRATVPHDAQQVTTWSTDGPRWPGRPARCARRGRRSAPPTPAAPPRGRRAAPARARARRRAARSSTGRPVEHRGERRARARRPAARRARAASMDDASARWPARRTAPSRSRVGPREQLRAHHPGVDVRAARRGDQVERGERARQVAPRAADAGQAERGRRRVVRVGARADDVQRLRDVRLAAAARTPWPARAWAPARRAPARRRR